jgi:hypothetical protein
MEGHGGQTVVLVAGLPYSGKTAIVEHLMQRLPGKPIYIDAVFRDFVEEKDVCLQRWLAEGTRLVDRIIESIGNAAEPFIYVEIGILQPAHRDGLMRWIRDNGYRLLPVLLECGSRDVVRERQARRALSLASRPDKLMIAIGMEELDGPISAAFKKPGDAEGFLRINTAEQIEDNVDEICRRIAG